MRDCVNGEVRDRLPELVHGRLPMAERAAVLAHVGACAECAAELALLRELRGAMAAAPSVDVARIVAALPAAPRPLALVDAGDPAVVPIEAARRRASRTRRTWGGRWQVAAAIATLMVGGTSVGILARQRAGDDAGVVAAAGGAGEATTGGNTTPAPVRPSGGGAAPPGVRAPVAPVQVASRAGDVDQVGGGLLADATDAELQALIDEMEQFDGTLVAEPEPVSPVVGVSGTNGTSGGA